MVRRQHRAMPRFRDEILRAQLRPVLALALAFGVAVALAVMLQYLSLRWSKQNSLDAIQPEELFPVLVHAQPEQWPQLARWLVRHGLDQQPEGLAQVRLTDGQVLPLHVLVQLVKEGQRIDPISLKPVGPAPGDWLVPLGAQSWRPIAAHPEGARGNWNAMLLDLRGGQRLVLQAPAFELSAIGLAQTVSLLFGAIVVLTGGFVALFLWFFRNRFAASSAARLALPLERLADALTRFAADQTHPVHVPVEPPLELAQLADAANLLQQRLSASVRELAQVNEDQRSFIAEISHELRTPLTVIRGHAERMGRELDHGRSADVIMRQVEDLHWLLSDLIDLSRISSITANLNLGAVSLPEVLTEMHTRFHAPAWRQGVLLRLEDCAGALSVQSDPRWLRQVLANLLTNAVRHTPEGGLVSLSATLQGEYAHILIDDSGSGIVNDHETVDYIGRGAGIGLRVVRSLLQAMGGSLRAQINDVGGTGMVVVLKSCTDPQK